MVPWTSGKKVNSVIVGCFIATRSSWLTGGFRSFIPEVSKVSREHTEKPPSQLHVPYVRCRSFSLHFCSANRPCTNANTQTARVLHGLPLANFSVECSGLSIYSSLQLLRKEVSKLLHKVMGYLALIWSCHFEGFPSAFLMNWLFSSLQNILCDFFLAFDLKLILSGINKAHQLSQN